MRSSRIVFGVPKDDRSYLVTFIEQEEWEKSYQRDRDFGAFCSRYCVYNVREVRNLLESAGFDVVNDLFAQFKTKSITELSAIHGIKGETISKWFKEAGLPVKRGRHCKNLDLERLKRIYKKTGSYSAVAYHCKISPKTAKSKLESEMNSVGT